MVLTEPVDGIDGALKDGEEGKADPVLQMLVTWTSTVGEVYIRSATIAQLLASFDHLSDIDLTYLSVIGGSGAEQCLDTIVSWNDETSRVDEEFSGNVEEDEEEVDSTETENDVDLGNRGLLFEVVESSILGQLCSVSASALDRPGVQFRVFSDDAKLLHDAEMPTSLSNWLIWWFARSWKDIAAVVAVCW